MKREAFADCHPIVNFCFFGAVIAMTVFIMQPVCLVISLVSALVYLLYMQGAKKTFSYIGYLVPFLIAMVILNPLFNHEGMTIIAYLPNDNPVTLEAIYFGVFSAVMMAASIVWFNCCNAVFTSDKIIYLFGRVIPAMSLLISMTLRFVPRFKNHLLCVMQQQKSLMGCKTKKDNVKLAFTAFSATVSWALEQSIISADSMKSRGYGLKGRTAFSIYNFDKRDSLVIALIFIFTSAVAITAICGGFYWAFYPTFTGTLVKGEQIFGYICYFAVCQIPLALNIWEDRKWNCLRSEI